MNRLFDFNLVVYEYSEVLFFCDFIPYWSCFVTPVEDSVVITRISMLISLNAVRVSGKDFV